MISQDVSRLLELESGAQPAPPASTFEDRGAPICCGVLVAIAIIFLAAIDSYVWQMPTFH